MSPFLARLTRVLDRASPPYPAERVEALPVLTSPFDSHTQ